MKDKQQLDTQTKNWPFPISNAERTKESQALIDAKNTYETKKDLSNLPEALF